MGTPRSRPQSERWAQDGNPHPSERTWHGAPPGLAQSCCSKPSDLGGPAVAPGLTNQSRSLGAPEPRPAPSASSGPRWRALSFFDPPSGGKLLVGGPHLGGARLPFIRPINRRPLPRPQRPGGFLQDICGGSGMERSH
ncbi:hypothetical protein NDU88_005010 [Pleurodeles waltl]|uniref:Uncharacterized protein n=1 Tax=Pleurodeles waltl TaxID=8319 RepID=A0AAV7WAB5_PLEWA|nr:hypothetical protein NDU88_005010 [Pleurodeles waltl]